MEQVGLWHRRYLNLSTADTEAVARATRSPKFMLIILLKHPGIFTAKHHPLDLMRVYIDGPEMWLR